ncbi:ABC-three component system protein [Yersinia bercovieri]|uniref:ABC-three component system protein n=1 Tax=Yersinia bercovieri TaxID=634 RepID=UPI0005E68457|nr:ABC-three component system protein [Yersinia bercovieri]MDN0102462.1 hypothetical protein [Yersinia bercovieri]CNI36768.1 Uncharacterised protein [Yersinia bercovieri]
MKYNYSLISPFQFQDLVIHICFELLGMATETFSEGPDGGRDSRFDGQALLYPSSSKPWQGVTIIQAKHTLGFNKKFSDSDFFGNDSSIINKEVDKISQLIKTDNLENYLLFSNRKLPANINNEIIKYINSSTGLRTENIGLIGVEQIENYLKRFPHISKNIDLNPFDMPLNIEPDDLANIINSISDSLSTLPKEKPESRIIRTDFLSKNAINGVGSGYANEILKKIGEFPAIDEFLAMPCNSQLQEKYYESVDELAAKISIYKNDEHNFDTVLEKIIELLIERDSDLKTKKRLTRIMIYYMYYQCDIGENDANIA